MTEATVISFKGRKQGGTTLPGQVYIGRAWNMGGWRLAGSPWFNPYKPGRDGTLDECLARYEAHVRARPDLMAALPELRGKTLACWCKPAHACHGDTLIKLLAEFFPDE